MSSPTSDSPQPACGTGCEERERRYHHAEGGLCFRCLRTARDRSNRRLSHSASNAGRYAKQLNFEDPDRYVQRRASAGEGDLGRHSNDRPDSRHHIRDNRKQDAAGIHLRPVRVEPFLRRCRLYSMTVFVSRADAENETHIVAVCEPWTQLEKSK